MPQVTAPATAFGGLPATLVWSVTNRGAVNLTNAVWSEAVGISNLNGVVTTLAAFRFTNSLNVGAALVRTQAVVLPSSTAAGSVRYFVRVDSDDELAEADEANNTTLATNPTTLPAELTLTLSVGEVNEGGPTFSGTIFRNGDFTGALAVTLTNSHPAKLALTNLVLLPAGAASVPFPVTPLLNGVVDADVLVTLGAQADGYSAGVAAVVVRNVDLPQLTITVGAPSVLKGSTVPVTIARALAADRDLEVVLQSSDPSRLLLPPAITIRSNQLSQGFAALAVDNRLVDGTVTNQLQAAAVGFAPATANVVVLENLPTVTLRFAATNVSEGDGPLATVATLTRAPVTATPLVFDLVSSNAAKIMVPATAVIPANQASVSFPVSAVDNQIVDGDTVVGVRVFLRATGSIRSLAELPGATLLVRDDDGPTLRLTLARDTVPQGRNPATTGTITRNTATTAALTVSLATSHPALTVVPASVVIPIGAASATFNLATLNPGLPTGDQSVVLTASQPGFTPGVSSLVVSDVNLPDLVVTRINVATNAETDSYTTLGYRIENRGVAAAAPGFVTRFALSTTPSGAGATPLGSFPSPARSGRGSSSSRRCKSACRRRRGIIGFP